VPFALSSIILGVCLLYVAIQAGLSGSVSSVILAQTGFAIVLSQSL